jgi:transposase
MKNILIFPRQFHLILFMAKKDYKSLTDSEKAKILILVSHKLSFTAIGRHLGRNESSIRTWHSKFMKSEKFTLNQGRPTLSKPDLVASIVNQTREDPRSSIRSLEKQNPLGRETIRKMRHDNGLHYYKCEPITSLTPTHELNRMKFCEEILNFEHQPPIIFTDESTVVVDLNIGGIWRYKGEKRADGFYVLNAHPVHVMVWGGIGTDGFKTPLLRCPQRVNKESYTLMLVNNDIPDLLKERYGDNYLFQQDNATPHKSARAGLSAKLNFLPWWPSKSPDLSPIEMIWAFIKQKLRGQLFISPESLFEGIEGVWNSITPEIIIKFTNSFIPRLTICLRLRGVCLNGHWQEVRSLVKKNISEIAESDMSDE